MLEALRQSDQRAIRTVDSLSGADWSAPSLLPGWTRAHVVAHLALNAEGFDRALDALQESGFLAVYDSNAARDEAIEDLAAQDPAEIRDRYFGATTRLRHTFGSLTADQWEATVSRLPEGPQWPVPTLPTFRRREVEIHHADLGAAYGSADWPEDFVVGLLDLVAPNHERSDESDPFTARATDLDRTWDLGAGSPVVSGTAAALAWWLVGRGTGAGLSTDPGPLPAIGPWAAR